MAAFLPYTLSPYATKTQDERIRKSLFAKAMRNRGAHREFARIKAARTYASEVCAEFATAAVEAPRRVVAVALALKAFSITNVLSVNTTLDVMLLVTLAVAAVSARALERRRGQAKMVKEMLFVEKEYLKAQTKGTFLCRWAPDPYEDPAAVNATSKDKALTNSAVADALATSCKLIGVEPETSMALILDAADGRTSKVLIEKGVPKTSIWVPNLYTHVVHSLRKDVGVNGVATKVEAFLAARDPRETQLHAIYLDHCGSIDGRTQQLFDVFSRHNIADGGIIAVTFSTRGKREGRGKAASVQLAAKALTEAAETHGYVLEGDAAPNIEGLADYTVAVRSDLGQTHAASSSQAKAAELLRETADFVAEAMEMDNDGMIAASLALWVRDSRPTSESEEALQTSKEKRQRRLADDLSKRALKRLDADKPLADSDARALRSPAQGRRLGSARRRSQRSQHIPLHRLHRRQTYHHHAFVPQVPLHVQNLDVFHPSSARRALVSFPCKKSESSPSHRAAPAFDMRVTIASTRATIPRASASRRARSSSVRAARVGEDVDVPRRRDVLFSLVAAIGGGASAREARAGEVLDGLVRYRDDARAAYEKDPEDEVLKGQLNFFEKQVKRTRENAEFVDSLRGDVMSGSTNYVGGMVFEVKDVQAEVDFWTKALGMRVTSDVGDGAKRVATLAYGQTSLNADDGGKAAVEIRQAPEGAMGSVGNVLSYVAVTVPFGLRVSQIYESGGELVYGFGFFDMRSPGGIPVRGQVATRRDPLETIALNVRDVRDAEKALVKEFGFAASKPLDANAYAPKSPPGSRVLYLTSATKTLTVILQPWREREALKLGDVVRGVVVARGGDASAPSAFVDARASNVPFLSRPCADYVA